MPSLVVMDRTHGYQDAINLTNVWDSTNATNDQSFWYTANNRLQNATGAYGDLTFYHDGVGNRTYRILDQGGSVETQVFGYPATSNLIDDVTTNGAVTRSFAHDAAGNMTADTRNGVAYEYAYNANNRLASVSTGGLLKASYVYNAFEQLVSRTRVNMSPAGTVHMIHDRDGNVIAESDGAGTTVREYVWLPDSGGNDDGEGIALPLAAIADANTASPATYFVHADHLNRPVAMTDEAKQVVWSASYLPYGGEYQITGPAALDARFPGQWFQLESGLAYNWHRHYDASLGRYTQPDPLGVVDGPSRYAYAVNSPLRFVDLLGFFTEVIQWGPGGGSGSYWGHISGNVNGKNYSFGPKGWDSNPSASAYAQRQLSELDRAGRGVVLSLTANEERQLEQCLKSFSTYNSVANNCGNPWLKCLEKLGAAQTGNRAHVLPYDVFGIISGSPKAIGNTSYPGSKQPIQ